MKIAAYFYCISLKSININKFGSTWPAVFSNSGNLSKKAVYLKKVIFPIFCNTAFAKALVKNSDNWETRHHFGKKKDGTTTYIKINKTGFLGGWTPYTLKVIGGQGSFLCQAQIKVIITGVSTLFMECQNSTLLDRYDRLNFWAFILAHSKYWAPLKSSI